MKIKEYWISDHGMWSEDLDEFTINTIFDQFQMEGKTNHLSLFIIYVN